jgi:hypothetical protein
LNLQEQKEGISERKEINELERNSKKKILETYIEESVNVRRVTNLEVTLFRMRMVVSLQMPTVL